MCYNDLSPASKLIPRAPLTSESSEDKERKNEDKSRRLGASELTDDDLLLAPPLLYGFSLSNKKWSAFPATF
jgi:hypothetical protein